MNLYLPRTTQELLQRLKPADGNPALQLDKYSETGDQTAQKRALDQICQMDPLSIFADLYRRWSDAIKGLPDTTTFICQTLTPLTLHLSRASALENAGICLHRIYGFVYLPGSGLKGMARAYAETVWLPTQPDQKQAWRQIEDVFGWAPNPERQRLISDPDHPAERRLVILGDQELEIKACCGSIIFHDAWPVAWPTLMVDIVNNHHPDYYQAPDNDNNHAPGDWENPVPVYFLCCKPGTKFLFALSKRRSQVPDELLQLAQEWLIGALCHQGAGAKANAGYGAFTVCEDVSEPLKQRVQATWEAAVSSKSDKAEPIRAEIIIEVELVSPGFFAGAEQFGNAAREGCNLRSATLRGLLRWWWRTLHAGFIDIVILRALEASIWGNTESGGAVRIVIERISQGTACPYDKRSKAQFDNTLKKSDYGIPGSDPTKTTQGLWYTSYGMDESRGRRWYLEPGPKWRIRIICRTAYYDGQSIPPDMVLKQALAALFLLCYLGGVGAKSRKGFGSLKCQLGDTWSLDKCREIGDSLRKHLGLPNKFQDSYYKSPSINKLLGPIEIHFTWNDIWAVLDQIGFAYQAFAKRYAHDQRKIALGLPRRIGRPGQPTRGQFRPQPPVQKRHASPVIIHVDYDDSNKRYIVRVVAFPAPFLPSLSESERFLNEFMQFFLEDLRRRAARPMPQKGYGSAQAPPRQATGAPRTTTAVGSANPSTPGLRSGEQVEAVLLSERTARGGWKARHEPTGLQGPIVNSQDVPADKKPGDKVTLIVQSVSPREVSFRYPTPSQQTQAKKRNGGR